MTLEPITYMLMGHLLRHGERGNEVDPTNPFACLCGEPDYLQCPNYGDGIQNWVIGRIDEDHA